jgi:PKD domain
MDKKTVGILVVTLMIASVLSVTGTPSVKVLDTSNVGMSTVEFFIEVVDLPETLMFDQEHVPDNYAEYYWSIFIDADNDITTGINPYGLAEGMEVSIIVASYKNPGVEPHEETILDGCQENTIIWDDTGGHYGHTINLIDITANTIRLSCSKSWEEMSDVDVSDRILIYTYYYSKDEGSCRADNATGYGIFTDPAGDVSYSLIDILQGGIVSEPPTPPSITGAASGKAGEEYEYIFNAVEPNGYDVYYYIEWGDDSTEEWIGPYESGEEIKLSHSWNEQKDYTIRVKAKNEYGAESDWATLEVSMPKTKAITLSNQGIFEAELGRRGSDVSFVALEGEYQIRDRFVAFGGTATADDKEGRFRGGFRGNHFIIKIPIIGRALTIIGRCSFDDDRHTFQGFWMGRGIPARGWITGTLIPTHQ